MASTSSFGPAHSVVKWRRRPLIGPAHAHSLDASSPRKIVGKNQTEQDPIQRDCPPPFRDRLSPGPPLGTCHWSIVRVFRSSSPKMGGWHVFSLPLSGRSVGAGSEGGESKERRRLLIHHHRMNTGLPATPSDTHLTSDYQTTWLNMHLRGNLS